MAKPGAALWASTDVRLMIEPPSAGMRGTTARTKCVTESKFSRTSACCPFGFTWKKSARNPPPALFTRMSTCPKRWRTASAKSPTCSSSRTSSCRVNAARPASSTSAAAAARFSASRSHMATSAPKRAKAAAMARPMPTAAPVTTATRSVSITLLGASGTAWTVQLRSGADMRLGLVTPVLTLNPRPHNAWEETAGFEAVATIAEAADRLGWHHVTCSEHVAVPRAVAPTRGSRYWDPLATFGYLAARTESLRLATHVLVLGYHHPLDIAKRYGTLDRISG